MCGAQMQLQDRMLDMAPSALTKTEATAQLVQVPRQLRLRNHLNMTLLRMPRTVCADLSPCSRTVRTDAVLHPLSNPDAVSRGAHGHRDATQVKEELGMERARVAELIRGRAFLEGRLQEIEASRAALEASLREQLEQVIATLCCRQVALRI